jgi:drug/metabolite transporter (DMT)-like permease
MELWFIYALTSGVIAGLSSFMMKISAEKNHNSPLIIMYTMFSASFFSFLLYLIAWVTIKWLWLLLILSIVMWITYSITSMTRIESLKNIGSFLYFPIYKSLMSVIVFLVWYYLFSERLYTIEALWIVLWISVPLILINKENNKREKNFVKWLILCLISAITTVIAIFMWKLVIINELDVYLYVSIATFSWAILSLIIYNRKIKSELHSKSNIKLIWLVNWIFITAWFILFSKSLVWNTIISVTINSFSIMIPIVLSVLIYKEKLDFKKSIAIILTIISIILLK